MDLNEYMNLPYNFNIHHQEDTSGKYYIAEVVEFKGCKTHGNTEKEALENLKDAMKMWIETSIEDSLPIPIPENCKEYSGNFNVRLPRTMHAKLVMQAKREGVSLNQYILYKLAML